MFYNQKVIIYMRERQIHNRKIIISWIIYSYSIYVEEVYVWTGKRLLKTTKIKF